MRVFNIKIWGICGIVALAGLLGFQLSARAAWQKPIQPSMAGGALTCLALHPDEPGKFLAASEHDIFQNTSTDRWEPLWSQTDVTESIKKIFVFSGLPDTVFVMADHSMFIGDLKDRSWRKIYQDPGKTLLSFAVYPQDPNHWFLGTRKGLWESHDAGKTWSPSSLLRGSGPVPLLVFDRQRLFIADDKTLYLAVAESSARAVFEIPSSAIDMTPVEDRDPEILEEPLSYDLKIRDLIVSKRDPQELFLATDSGVFQSRDSGYRWEPLPRSGLQTATILQLACSSQGNRLYAATPKGIYAFDRQSQRWTALFEGLANERAQSIAVLNDEKLLAITGEGFVQYPLGGFTPEGSLGVSLYQPPEETLNLLKELISSEPSSREVQKRVIRYANVGNGKIKRWHAMSRVAGLLPTFSLGKDRSWSPSIDLDRAGTNDPDRYILGPDDVSKSWNADVSWDLGDAIYSSDQTSIDSREKLMVELRGDLLSEVTRIYYERRRLQIDLIFTPPASEQEHLENLLRLDELTALLDGMTDGFFSKRLERLYDQRPEFQKLWNYTNTTNQK